MSLFALPVTAAELEDLQAGIQFFTNSAQATAQAAAINAGNTTVAAYAASLLNANLSTSQVAMAATCLMLGQSATIATLTNISTQFLPDQITNAIANGFNQTVYAAEALGLALGGEPEFAAFTALDVNQFSIAVAAETGVSTAAIQQFVTNWVSFYTANPSATFGLTITQASYGAAFGDAIGVALLNPTSANLQTVISTNAQGEVVIEGEVANDLLTIATGQYVEGIDCDLLPQHQALQGEAGSSLELTLTPLVDTPTQGFTTGTGGSFSNLATGGVFIAGPGSNPPLGTTNTLNAGDNLQGSQDGSSILELNTIDSSFFGANDPFALAVTMNNVGTANILNNADDLAGFAGNITGLTTVSILAGSNPTGDVQLGQAGQGLNTALQTININAGIFTPGTPDNGFDAVAGSDLNVFIQSSALTGAELLDINLGGVGTTVDVEVTGGANTYGTINVSSETGPNHIDLDAVVPTVTVDGDQDLEICGDALNQDTLTTFDSTAATGDITAFFEGENPGDVTVLGGAGNDNFTFITFDDLTGETTFTDTDSVDGGGGDNKLTLQAFEGALLGAGVGPNIVNIQTIVHTSFENDCFDDCNYETVDDTITVDMALSGSADILELQADYNNILDGVTVTNLTNADTIVYSGFDLFDLNVATTTLLGDVNLTMAQDECVEANFGPTDHVLEDVNLISGGSLNIHSIGVADLNQINDLDDVDADIIVTGDVDLTLGTKAAPYEFDGGVVEASAFTADLTLYVGAGSQTVVLGSGNDTIDVVTQNADEPDLYDLSVGGNDTVVFEDTDEDDGEPLETDEYTTITGFDLANDTIAIDVLAPNQIDLQETDGDDVDPGDAVNFYGLTFGQPNDNLAGQDINFISIQANNNSTGFSFQGYFNFLMDGTNIGVDADCNQLLMSMYDNLTGSAVLFVAEPDNTVLSAGDDVQMVALIQMSFTDYLSFGPQALSFVDFPA